MGNLVFPSFWPGTVSDWRRMSLPGVVFLTVGLHPSCIWEGMAADLLSRLDVLVGVGENLGLVVGIGECGVDFSRKYKSGSSWGKQKELQLELLRGQAVLARRTGLPLVIHCRGELKGKGDDWVAWCVCLGTLIDCLPRSHVVIRHCFTGGVSEMRCWQRAFDRCYFGFAGKAALLGKEVDPDVVRAARELHPSRILVETDAPHLPTGAGPLPSSPWEVGFVSDVVADWRGEDREAFLAQCTVNLRQCYGLR